MVSLAAAAVLLWTAWPAMADMVEIKGEGFVNGKILAEDEKSITLEDSHGRVRVLDRKTVGHVEIIKEKNAVERAGIELTGWAERLKGKLKKKPAPPPSKAKAAAKPAAVSHAPVPHANDPTTGRGLLAAAQDKSKSIGERKRLLKLAGRKLYEEEHR